MKTTYIQIKTKGTNDILDITPRLNEIVAREQVEDGILFLNVIGSTAALTTMEYEPGLLKDTKDLLDKLIPYRAEYAHNFTWNDDNGHSHLRSFMVKTNFFVPVTGGTLDLGTWQQVVLVECDTRPRDRKIVVKIMV